MLSFKCIFDGSILTIFIIYIEVFLSIIILSQNLLYVIYIGF